ncbi:hypothetical protein HanXRQr2_Chr14g0643731 [Helianthus annuus]|uniref:Uncharacterized protein n=1 Tax=Helianthus annuus TaxID=4232 RepID=A0A9K3E8V3_HELAN|nr:hypothetical protein HanXRQr2_Chr14g0643731 [Helianthus annuus]KAJ0840346.1 hypothetical protein HanPSC8_Chr14g0617611 [Helianthus annuus]
MVAIGGCPSLLDSNGFTSKSSLRLTASKSHKQTFRFDQFSLESKKEEKRLKERLRLRNLRYL